MRLRIVLEWEEGDSSRRFHHGPQIYRTLEELLGLFAGYAGNRTGGVRQERSSMDRRSRSGEESEKKAQEYMMNDLNNFCDEVSREEFKVSDKAFMSWIRILELSYSLERAS